METLESFANWMSSKWQFCRRKKNIYYSWLHSMFWWKCGITIFQLNMIFMRNSKSLPIYIWTKLPFAAHSVCRKSHWILGCVCVRVCEYAVCTVCITVNNESLYDFEHTPHSIHNPHPHPSGCFQIDDNTFIYFCIFFLKSQSVSLENLCDMNNFLLDIMVIHPFSYFLVQFIVESLFW